MQIIKTNLFKLMLLALLLISSLIFNHNVDFWIGKEYNYYQLFFTVSIASILFLISNKPLQLGKTDIVVIFILLSMAVSRSLRLGTFNEIHVINTFLLMLYYISLKTIRLKKEEINTYYQLIIGVGVLLSSYCILELADIVEPNNFYWRMKGNFPNPGPLGGFIALILTFAFYELAQKEILKRPLKLVVNILITILMVFVLIKSESRAAMFSVVIALVIIVSYYGFKKWKNFKYLLLLLVPIFIFISFSKSTDSILGRLLIWKISLLSFLERPFTGIGYGFFGVEYLNFQADYFSKGGTKEEILLAGANEQAFNEFLKFVVENGALGLILIIPALFWIVKSKNQNSLKDKISLASIAFYSSFTVFACFSFPLQFLAFKLLLLNQIGLQNYPSFTLNFKFNKNFQKILLGSVTCFLLFIITSHHKTFKAWKDGSELQFTNSKLSNNLFRYAFTNLEYEASFLSHYAITIEEKNPKEALSFYKKAKQLTSFPTLYKKTAQLNEKIGNYKDAEVDYLKIHFISPHLFLPLEQLVDFYNRRGNTKKSNYYSKKIIETPIKISSTEVLRIKQKAKNQLTLTQLINY